ncbi:MAG TPA: PKD domain-containing protein [Candidatus Paceibacterota bacterium]
MKKQYIALALSLAIIAPVFAFADTTTTSVTVSASVSAQIAMLQAQIKSLMARIEALKNQQGPIGERWCHAFNTNLGVGAKGDEVAALVNALSQDNPNAGLEHSSNFAASFDERMASAASGFQEKYRDEILTPNGLKYGTGFVGKSTRAKLNALYGCRVVIDPNPGKGGGPVLNGVSGPTVLAVNQTGTWTISAYDPRQGALTYSVTWGDENYPAPMVQSASGAALGSQSTTFTHSYSTAGKYKVSFTVKDTDGNTAYSNITVQVGATNSGSISVLSPNGGETWYKGSTQTIKWQDMTPVPMMLCEPGPYCVPPAPTSYDIKLAPYYAPCTTSPCPLGMPYRVPYTIVKGVYGSSYNWSVAHTIDIDAIGNAPDGSYTVQVCKAGTEVCDSSDSYFKIQTIYTTQSGQ